MQFAPRYVTTLITVPAWICMGFGWLMRDPYVFAFGAVSLVAIYLSSIDARLKDMGPSAVKTR